MKRDIEKQSEDISDIQEILKSHAEHLQIANSEMGVIKEDIAEIKIHINWVQSMYEQWEKRWDKLDNRIWLILSSIILGFLVSIYLK